MQRYLADIALLSQMRASFTAMQNSIGQWADRTFPSHHDADGKPNARGPIHHLADPVKGEAKELLDAFEAGQPLDRELADCAILVFCIAHLSGISLYDVVVAKMDQNMARKWAPPDSKGICEHVREPEKCGTCGAEMHYRPEHSGPQPSGYWYCPKCAYKVTLTREGAD